jgi:hypothetical protein
MYVTLVCLSAWSLAHYLGDLLNKIRLRLGG